MNFTLLTFLKKHNSLEDTLFPYYSQMTEEEDQHGYLEYEYCDKNYEAHGYKTKEELIKDLKPKIKSFNEDYIYAHNPNGMWDWYLPGGRWNNMLLNDKGEKVNSCLVANLDLKEMKKQKIQEYKGLYERINIVFSEIKNDKLAMIKLWRELFIEHPELYLTPYPNEINDFFNLTKEQYYHQIELEALNTYAIVDLEGNWMENTEHTKIEWLKIVHSTVEKYKQDKDNMMVMVDCHN